MTQPNDEQLDLIKSCIVQHPDYDPKKCRMSELVNLVWEKSSMFIGSIGNENTVKKYLVKIVGENLEKCNIASDIAHIQEAQANFLAQTDITPREEPTTEIPPATQQAAEVNIAAAVDWQSTTEQKEIEPKIHQEKIEITKSEEPVELNEVKASEIDETAGAMSSFYKLEQALEEVASEPYSPQEQHIVAHIEELTELQQIEELAEIQQIEEIPEISVQEPILTTPPPIQEPVRPVPPPTQEPVRTMPPQTQEPVSPSPSPVQAAVPSKPQESAYEHVADPLEGAKNKRVSKELSEKVISIVRFAHSKDPGKQYFKIFYLKYVQKMKQSEIAMELAISEEELCDRYLKLVRIVKNGLNQGSTNS